MTVTTPIATPSNAQTTTTAVLCVVACLCQAEMITRGPNTSGWWRFR
jgi:hypothetical protein